MGTKKTSEQAAVEMLCPVRYMLEMFSGKWKLPIICMLSRGEPLRYSSLKRKLGDITNVMLSQSLKDLESYGIVHREQYNEVPPRVEYTLTEKGVSVLPTIGQIAEWALKDLQAQTTCGVYCEKCVLTR